jgi:hypothetical protein
MNLPCTANSVFTKTGVDLLIGMKKATLGSLFENAVVKPFQAFALISV